MYHNLGETSHLVRGLVFGVRPSIAWRLGMQLAPLDNLTADGQLGWQVGLGMIMRRQERQPDRTPESVISWLRTRTANGHQCRVRTLEVVESLWWSLPSLNDEILAMDTDEFVECWTRNLQTSVSSSSSRSEILQTRFLVGDTIRQLSRHPGTESLSATLSNFGHADDIQPRGSWPQLLSPRLHPPSQHRQDWLDVLAEVNVASDSRIIADSLRERI